MWSAHHHPIITLTQSVLSDSPYSLHPTASPYSLHPTASPYSLTREEHIREGGPHVARRLL